MPISITPIPGSRCRHAWRIRWSWRGDRWGPNAIDSEVYGPKRNRHDWGGFIRFDGPRAETPIDWHIGIGPLAAIYGSTARGARINQALRVPAGAARELRLRVEAPPRHPSRLLVHALAWADPEHPTRRLYVHPVDRMLTRALGRTKYTAEQLDTTDATAHLVDGAYPLTLTLQRETWKRPRWPRPSCTRTSVEYTVKPTSDGGRGYAESSDKWGGDGLVSSSVSVTPAQAANRDTWVSIAVGAFVTHVTRDRARHHWTPQAAA